MKGLGFRLSGARIHVRVYRIVEMKVQGAIMENQMNKSTMYGNMYTYTYMYIYI